MPLDSLGVGDHERQAESPPGDSGGADGYLGVEPTTLTNEDPGLAADFSEARGRTMFPRFELRAPMVANAQWAETTGGAYDAARFRQSGAAIGATFDESGRTLRFEPGASEDQRPWVTAVDEMRWALGHQALEMVGIRPEELGYPIIFAGPNGQKKGTTFTVDRHIEVYISQGDSVVDVAHVIGHEFGHALDVSWNSPQDRRRWLEARGLAATTSWWPRDDLSDLTTGSGDFAECFASWRVDVAPRSRLAGSCQAQFFLLDELWRRDR